MIKELETWFSGGGLADIGFAAAGLNPSYAIELEDAIAQCYRRNLGNHCVTGDVTTAPLAKTPYWFHVSPPCTNASVAKTDGEETELDIELAKAVVRGIERKSPWFSLENVWGYRSFESFRLICEALGSNGYNFAYWHLNAADYGVPQTRKRLILVASRVKRVIHPQPTHGKDPGLFWLPWVGWYEAISDLIPSLPEAQFAKWQLDRLPNQLTESCLINTVRKCSVRAKGEPSLTVTSSWMRSPASTPRVFLMNRSQAKVAAVNARCLARLQSVPDWYELPEKNPLAGNLTGNGCPPMLMQALVSGQSA